MGTKCFKELKNNTMKELAVIELTDSTMRFIKLDHLFEIYERGCGLIFETENKIRFKSVECLELMEDIIYLPGKSIDKDLNLTRTRNFFNRNQLIKYMKEFAEHFNYKLDNSLYNDPNIFVIC